MKAWLPLLILATSGIGACHGVESADSKSARHGGRYAGIGTYPAGEMWAQMNRKDAPADPKAATIADDQQIVVVVDSRTGEVRQCGNLSGICIAQQPWAGTSKPVILLKHAATLKAESALASSK